MPPMQTDVRNHWSQSPDSSPRIAVSLRASTHGAHGPPSCPQLPRALLGRLRRCREAGGGAALHAGGWTVAGTRAWGAWVTDQASRAVAARLCCAYPEEEGRRQELHGPWRERACLLSLSCAKCLGNTRESWMRASRLVAQRVRCASGIDAREITP